MPFVGATAQAIIARVVTEEPRSLTLQRKTIPPHVEAAVMTALAKLREPAVPPQMTPPQTTTITNLTRVTNMPLMLNTNLLRQTMSNAAMRLTNTVRTATNAAATNLPKVRTTPPQTNPAAPATSPAPAAK